MIDPVGGSASLSAVRPQPWQPHAMQAVMSSVANLFGMSSDDLRSSLQGGLSLSDIASQKGISQDQLVSTVSQALQSAGGLPPGADPNAIAQKIVERKGGHHGHHHHVEAAPPAGSDPDGDGDVDGTGAAGTAGELTEQGFLVLQSQTSSVDVTA